MPIATRVLPPPPVVAGSVAGLEELAPEALGAALAGLALPSLTGTETVLALIAAKRLRNYADGLIYQYTRETLRRADAKFAQCPDPKPGSPPTQALAGVNEVRAALDLSREQAVALCATARRLDGPLWPLQQTMLDGDLDAARVRVFDRETRGLSNKHAEIVAVDLSYPAHNLSARELVEQIRACAIKADPRAAARREKAAVAHRRVQVHNQADGTASIAGRQLPIMATVLAAGRLDTLARAARRAGHPGSMGTLRAEVFLGKLNGRFDGLDDEAIVAVLLAQAGIDGDCDPSASSPDESTVDGGSGGDRGTDDRERYDGVQDDGEQDDGDRDYSDEVWARLDQLPRFADHDDDNDADIWTNIDEDGVGCDRIGSGESGAGVCLGYDVEHNGPARRAFGRGLRLVADVTTLAGLTEHPATLLGWNVLHPDLARRVASTPHASWHYVLLDPDGRAVQVQSLRQRPDDGWAPGPTPDPATSSDYRNLECWLTLTRTDLITLQTGPPPGWVGVIAELAERINATADGPPNGEPRRRFPSKALRRWIGIRDGVCVFPTCDVPAHECDMDHTVDHARGGDTLDHHLAPLCEADHLAKHNDGWQCVQVQPGWVVWISPVGIHYLVIPPHRPGMPPRLIRLLTPDPPPEPDPDEERPPF